MNFLIALYKIAFQSKADHPRTLFSLLCPWSWPDITLSRYPEDVVAYQKWTIGQGFQKLSWTSRT